MFRLTSAASRVCSLRPTTAPCLPVVSRDQNRYRRSSSKARTPNHYETLGISESASLDEVKRAFYDLSMRHHPDKTDGSREASDRFQRIVDAYDAISKRLSDQSSKAAHADYLERENIKKSKAKIDNFLKKIHNNRDTEVNPNIVYAKQRPREPPQVEKPIDYSRLVASIVMAVMGLGVVLKVSDNMEKK